MHELALLPFAHVSHWLWLLYVPPVLIVLASIVRTKLSERRDRERSARRSD